MGTGKTGRYLNTKGSGRSVSDYVQVHSNEGTFVKSQIRVDGKKKLQMRLASGGHGQEGMDLLDKYKIDYHVEKTYPNGVRVGYIPNHKNKFKQKSGGQTWFPSTWKEKDIRHAGEHVAGLKSNRHIPDGTPVFGMYKGIRVGIIKTNGKIGTVFPDSYQPINHRRKNK